MPVSVEPAPLQLWALLKRLVGTALCLNSRKKPSKSTSWKVSAGDARNPEYKQIDCIKDDVVVHTTDSKNDLWGSTVQSALSILMDAAEYDSQVRAQGISFFQEHVKPFLGKAPTSASPSHWRSFMTDDYSPVEYSWTWEAPPKIRYSFEPIGDLAGTKSDPFNREAPSACIRSMRQSMPDSDWQLFDRLADRFYDSERGGSILDASANSLTSSPSSIMLAAEIDKAEAKVKAYLVPVRAQQTGESRFTVLSQGLKDLQESLLHLPACPPLTDYIHQCQSTAPLDLIGVAVDCVDPQMAKLKIYLRSQKTCFDDVYSTLTMNGLLKTWDDTTRGELWELWQLVLGLTPSFQPQDELPPTLHETGGILYNFDIQTNNTLPDTKLYIPVKHYGRHDGQVWEGLKIFLDKRGEECYTGGFEEALKAIVSSYRSLEDGCGLQTYISCAVKKGRLQLTSYISAEIYHANRWR